MFTHERWVGAVARIMPELGTLDRQLSDHATLPASREFRDAYAAASAAHR